MEEVNQGGKGGTAFFSGEGGPYGEERFTLFFPRKTQGGERRGDRNLAGLRFLQGNPIADQRTPLPLRAVIREWKNFSYNTVKA